jgi:hypothetical protein
MKKRWNIVINVAPALVLVATLGAALLPEIPVRAQAIEILKPTAYTFSDNQTNNNPEYAYDGSSGGEDTTYNRLGVGDNDADPTIEYHTWQSPSQTHTARRLYIRRSGTGNTDDTWGIYYSTNGGANYTSIETGLTNPAKDNTTAVTIDTGLDLSYLWVKISTSKSKKPDGGFADIWDVWLEGDYQPLPVNVSVELWTTGGSPSPTSSMTPQVEYNAKVYVEHENTLDDLNTVTVRIFYDSYGTYVTGDESGAADTQSRAILIWTNGGNPWSIDPSASTTWELVSGSCVEPSLSASSGTFEFHFKPGKVATETTGVAKWHLYAEADDGTATYNDTDKNKDMNWYGEIKVNTVNITWGPIAPGTDFNDSTNQTSISVTYIANGAYNEQVAASSSWTSASGNAILNADGNPGANEFSLKAHDTAALGSAVLVAVLPTYITIDDTGMQTTESGDTVTNNTLWLKLGTPLNEDIYAGTIYYRIAQ